MKIRNEDETLLEIAVSKAVRVDKESGVIHGVKVLGRESSNGRTYLDSAIRSGAPLYEKRAVYVDHPPRSAPDMERKIGEKFGWLENIQVKSDGLYGDLHYLKSHAMAGSVVEVAERDPSQLGLSHNASGKTRRQGDKTLVEEIRAVRSVDLVTDPATTRGLFESEEHVMPKTVKEVLESLDAKDPHVKWLREAIGEDGPMAVAADAPVEAEGVDSKAAIKDAFKTALLAVIEDESLDMQATIAKIRDIMKAEEKITAEKPSDGGEEGGEDEEGGEEEESAPESKDPKLAAKLAMLEARDKARDLLESSGIVEPDKAKRDVMIESLSALKTDKAREALIQTWKGTSVGERPRSGGGGVLFESNSKESTEDFIKSLR